MVASLQGGTTAHIVRVGKSRQGRLLAAVEMAFTAALLTTAICSAGGGNVQRPLGGSWQGCEVGQRVLAVFRNWGAPPRHRPDSHIQQPVCRVANAIIGVFIALFAWWRASVQCEVLSSTARTHARQPSFRGTCWAK